MKSCGANAAFWDGTYQRNCFGSSTLKRNGLKKMDSGGRKSPGYKNVDRLKKKLAEHGAVFMTTDDAGIDLPKRNFVPVRTPPAKEYWKFWRERAISINTATFRNLNLIQIFGVPMKAMSGN